jgi:hypothetical protein
MLEVVFFPSASVLVQNGLITKARVIEKLLRFALGCDELSWRLVVPGVSPRPRGERDAFLVGEIETARVSSDLNKGSL